MIPDPSSATHSVGAVVDLINQAWLFPRKTFMRRKTAGENVDHQMIAANIDSAFIVQSCHFDFNPSRLDRYLVMAADGHVEPFSSLRSRNSTRCHTWINERRTKPSADSSNRLKTNEEMTYKHRTQPPTSLSVE
jgi:putative ribosome biogenesis GTPase RsgA